MRLHGAFKVLWVAMFVLVQVWSTLHSPAPSLAYAMPETANAQVNAQTTRPREGRVVSDRSSPDLAPASASLITLTAAGFEPAALSTTFGTDVTWVNATSLTQILVSGEPLRVFLPLMLRSAAAQVASASPQVGGTPQGVKGSGLFAATLPPGGSFTYTFYTAGVVPYYLANAPQFNGRVIVQADLPPDPATIAPPLDPTVPTDIAEATEFLYTGPNPIQTGVASGTIETRRVAVLRGRVLTSAEQPLPNVTVTVLDHPEYGLTRTRADGMFDLAVNGGGRLTLDYAVIGHLSAQRAIDVPWLDYVQLPDVVLLQEDPRVTAVDLASPTMQMVQGSVMTDTNGVRQAVLLIPPGTQATLVLTGGVTQTLNTFHARITEYTVGEHGPQAMPADLPPQSGYTYAVEYSVDEAVAAAALGVRFSQPLIHYSHNFLNFPLGMAVPNGYYDRITGQWIATDNGRVVKVIDISGSLANLDTDGDGIVDNGAVITPTMALTITTAERQRVAEFAGSGQSLWRVPLTHLSPYDMNWPYGPPAGASPPAGNGPTGDDANSTNNQCGSLIGCQGQTLGESVDLAGTPFRLSYTSSRVAGRRAAYSLDIPLSGNTLPPGVKGIELVVKVAGQSFTQAYAPASNLNQKYTWDGQDVYGRKLIGKQPISVRVGYRYDAVYMELPLRAAVFGMYGELYTQNGARQEVTLWQEWRGSIGALQPAVPDLGGWDLSVRHVYDAQNRTLYLGSGGQRDTDSLNFDIITTAAGSGQPGYNGDNIPATQSRLYYPTAVAAGPDGSLDIADTSNYRVRRVLPNGIITTVAGNGQGCYLTDPCGDGGPATQAQIGDVSRIAVGPDGSIYMVSGSLQRVRRVGPDGIITTVAGNGTVGAAGDGGPATQAQMNGVRGVAVGIDGTLYIVEGQRLRRVGTDGLISTVAGNGQGVSGYNGDGIPASQALLAGPQAVAVGPDGSVYIAETMRIRRIGLDGIITTVAGNGQYCAVPTKSCGDGGLATSAKLHNAQDIALGPDGSLYIADTLGQRVRRVGPDGIITTIAGTGVSAWNINRITVDGGVARRFDLWDPKGVAVGPDGAVYIADNGSFRIRRVASALPGGTQGDLLIPSEDGGEVYVFDAQGRHLRTLQAQTGAIVYQFAYNGRGRLTSVTDGDGNVTTITRDANGNPTGIVAPFGQVTALTRDVNGYLASIANPAKETVQLGYTADGLLTTYRDPRNGLHTFQYDALGRLTQDTDPAAGYRQLSRQESEGVYTVTLTTALGRTDQYRVELSNTGDERHVNTDPAGLQSESVRRSNATEFRRAPDGTTSGVRLDPDPRWGMLAPVSALVTTTLPSGLAFSTQTTRTATLTNPTDPFSLNTQTETVSINSRSYTSTYTAATRTWVSRSPAGRTVTTTIDAQGRVVYEQAAGLAPAAYVYDSRGRLSMATTGTGADARVAIFAYNSAGYLASVTDPLNRTTSFDYDLAGRVTHQTLPDGRVIDTTYDLNGNLASLAPPGRPAHAFDYTPVDLASRYAPPDVNPGSDDTLYTYNPDRQFTLVTRPDGQTLGADYDSAGRLNTLTLARGILSITYGASTGNLASITAPGGIALAYAYDGSLNTGVTWSGPIAGTAAYTYDTDLRLASSDVNGSGAIAHHYDPDNLLMQTGALSLSRDTQNGLLMGSTLGSVADTWSYNSFAEPITYDAAHNTTPLHNVQYAQDKLGRIAQKTEIIEGVTDVYVYGYDQAGRLGNVTKNGVQESAYAYDSNGNRLSYTGPGGTINATYDAQDRLLQYGGTTYTYTANGELLTKTNGTQTTNYQYDAFGNLITITLPSGTQIAYLVDGQNRRFGKKVNGVLAQGLLYDDQLRPAAQLDVSGSLVSRFVYATRVNVPDYMVKNGVTYRLILDHLGSPRLVVNAATGQIVQRMDYDAFGRVLTDTNPGFQPFGFAGGLYDPDTGLVRFGARDFDAETGRWMSKDLLGFSAGDMNLYRYAFSDPMNLRDPNGQDTYVCTKPLDALGGKNAAPDNRRSGPDLPGNPLYHKYLCIDDDGNPGKKTCGGQSSVGGKPYAPGSPSKDTYVPQRCEKVPDGNKCVEQCLLNKINNPSRPYYGLIGSGTNCQEWADDALSQCRKQCKG